MILIIVIQLVVHKHRTRHESWNLKSQRTVNLSYTTAAIILHSNFLNIIGKDKHGYANTNEDKRHKTEL